MIISISGKIGSGKDTIGTIIQYLTAENTEAGKAVGMHCTIEEYLSNMNNSCSDVFKIKKWAYKVKQVATLLTGIPIEKFEDQEFKKTYLENFGMTVRDLLQKVGTDAIRDGLHVDSWVLAMMSEYFCPDCGWIEEQEGIDGCHMDNHHLPNWIITDTRFPNELKAVKDVGGITIRVNRPFAAKYIDDSTTAFGMALMLKAMKEKIGIYHPSETALDDAKFDYEIDNEGTLEELIEKVKIILKTEKII